MSNQNMSWQQFLQEFVLRTLTQIEVLEASDEAYYIRASIRIARESWDAIQAAEMPESEKAKQMQIGILPTTKEQLKLLALEANTCGAKWIAQDKFNGMWYGYAAKPQFVQSNQEWQAEPGTDYQLIELFDNTDYSKQLFNVKEILNNE